MRTFSYNFDGLSYEVTVRTGEDGNLVADISVLEGEMDVNAIYWGDDDFDGDSFSLGGPLNMNGDGQFYEGERIEWDDAIELSRPGLGREGTDKETFLQAGETLSVDLPEGLELDDIDFFGIRATSVNDGGSIKGVSGDPEIEDPQDDDEDNGDDDNGDDATFDKVIFSGEFDFGSGLESFNVSIQMPDDREQPDPTFANLTFLDEDKEGTLEDYVERFFEVADDPEFANWPPETTITQIELQVTALNEDGSVKTAPDGNPILETVGVIEGDELEALGFGGTPLPTYLVEEDGTELDHDDDEPAEEYV